MNPWPVEAEIDEVHLPRPGHADLPGLLKYGHTDVRNVLERASARETAARVAAGALAEAHAAGSASSMLSHVTRIGTVTSPERDDLPARDFEGVDESPVRCLDDEASAAMVAEIGTPPARRTSRSAACTVIAFGLVPGIGSHLLEGTPRRPAGRRDHVDPGDEGGRHRRRLRPGRASGLAGPRRGLLVGGAGLLPPGPARAGGVEGAA